jgi:hypothetical protein
MRITISALILAAFLLSGCKKQNTVRIHGNYAGHGKENVVLMKNGIESNVFVDSVKIKNNGDFKFDVTTEMPEFYFIQLKNKKIIPLLLEPGEEVNVELITSQGSLDYTVTGSKGSQSLRTLDQQMFKTRYMLDSIITTYEEIANLPGNDLKISELNMAYENAIQKQRKYNIAFIVSNLRSMASIYALYQKIDSLTFLLNKAKDIQYYKLLSDTLSKYYPKSDHVVSLNYNADALIQNFYSQRQMELAEKIGKERLPELEMLDIHGTLVKLSSLTGKIVLLSFWDPSDQNSIDYSLQLLPVYKKYKNKGFEIYQVAVTTSLDNWRRGVVLDELPWVNVSDLQGPKSYAVSIYNITGLPSNYLIDKEQQKVLGKNLDAGLLQIKLDQNIK